jgi:GTPase SAR1 family protein
VSSKRKDYKGVETMNILIVGQPDTGKSNLADIIKNNIFKMDKESTIVINDYNKDSNSEFGSGVNKHKIKIIKRGTEGGVIDFKEFDIVIDISSKSFKEWFDQL